MRPRLTFRNELPLSAPKFLWTFPGVHLILFTRLTADSSGQRLRPSRHACTRHLHRWHLGPPTPVSWRPRLKEVFVKAPNLRKYCSCRRQYHHVRHEDSGLSSLATSCHSSQSTNSFPTGLAGALDMALLADRLCQSSACYQGRHASIPLPRDNIKKRHNASQQYHRPKNSISDTNNQTWNLNAFQSISVTLLA